MTGYFVSSFLIDIISNFQRGCSGFVSKMRQISCTLVFTLVLSLFSLLFSDHLCLKFCSRFSKINFFCYSYCNQNVIHSLWNLFIVLKPEKGWRRCEILSSWMSDGIRRRFFLDRTWHLQLNIIDHHLRFFSVSQAGQNFEFNELGLETRELSTWLSLNTGSTLIRSLLVWNY